MAGPLWLQVSVSPSFLVPAELWLCWLGLWLLSTLFGFNPEGLENSLQLRRAHGQTQPEGTEPQCLPSPAAVAWGELFPPSGLSSLRLQRSNNHSSPFPFLPTHRQGKPRPGSSQGTSEGRCYLCYRHKGNECPSVVTCHLLAPAPLE